VTVHEPKPGGTLG